MATAELFKPINSSPSTPRNAFSVGYSTLFTSPAGLLLPAYVEDVKAGDKVKLSLSSITRTRPVNTAAFMSFDEKTDFWFVPYRLLWSDYTNWRLSTAVPRTTFANSDIGNQILAPSTTWASIGKFINNLEGNSYNTYNLEAPSCSFFLRQMDLLGYSIPPVADLLLNAVDDSFGKYENSDSRASGSGSGRWPSTESRPGSVGNVRPPSIPSGSTSVDFASVLSNNFKAYDKYIGSPLNYFRLAAYQCIYMSSYRNEEYEKLDPSYYNADNLFLIPSKRTASNYNTGTGDPSSTVSTPRNLCTNLICELSNSRFELNLHKLFTPRYKNWRKDIFTGLKPTDLMSVNGMSIPAQSSGSSFDFSGAANSGEIPKKDSQFIDDYTWLNKANAYFPYIDIQSMNNELLASNIRLLFAQDKFARANLYADKDFKSQMKAVFGVSVSEPDVPRYLGTHSSNISINEIVATSAGEANFDGGSSSSVLGELAGKGFQSSDGFVFEDEFNEDGIIMGIHYIMPRNNYDSYRINRFNTKLSRFDYYYPQFDGLGLSPVLARELTINQLSDTDLADGSGLPTNILGYAPRYYEYKERQNEVHGVFMSGQCESNWTITNNKDFIDSGTNSRLFKIFPSITDSIFSLSYDGSQSTDPFMCYFNYNVTRVSDMEILGIPN